MKLQRKKESQVDVVGEYTMERDHRGVVGTDRERERDRRMLDGCGEYRRQTDWTDWFHILSLSLHLPDLILSL